MPSSHRLAAPALAVAAATWGVLWYPYRLLQEAGLSGSAASVVTYLVCLPLLFALLPRPARPSVSGERAWLLALALTVGWTNLSYVLAVIEGEVVRVMLLFYLAPLWTVPCARLILGERAGRGAWAVILLALGGAWVMLVGEGGWPLPHNRAEWLGLTSGMGFALTNVLSRRLRDTSVVQRSLWAYAGVVVLAALYAGFEGTSAANVIVLSGVNWGLIALTSALLLLATFTVQYGLAHVPANRAVVILLSELFVAAATSRWLAGETMDFNEWAGGAMIVAATLLSVRMERHA